MCHFWIPKETLHAKRVYLYVTVLTHKSMVHMENELFTGRKILLHMSAGNRPVSKQSSSLIFITYMQLKVKKSLSSIYAEFFFAVGFCSSLIMN